jgi:murein L,D-transpeptidase YcbB/YkuD
MPKRTLITLAVLAFVYMDAAMLTTSAVVQTMSDTVRLHLRHRLTATEPPELTVAEETLAAGVKLRHFYAQRLYHPAWSNDAGPLQDAEALLQVLQDAESEGLSPQDYHLLPIIDTLAAVRQAQNMPTSWHTGRLADLDLLLTDAFLTYGAHLLHGRQRLAAVDAGGMAKDEATDLARLLHHALATEQITATLHSLLPPYAEYTRLRQALVQYRRLAAHGGWPTLADGPPLHQGDQNERVVALRYRLRRTGDLITPPAADEALFDKAVEQAVGAFQKRHGLAVDGIVGSVTLAAMNVSVEERVRQLILNLDRRRWLPRQLGHRYVLINIPDFTVRVVEDDQPVLTMRAVVGKPSWPTPVLSSVVTHLIFNPFWEVPARIISQEILPHLRRDPAYLAQHHLRVIQGWEAKSQTIDPRTIDWSTVSATRFPYRLRQDPGPGNALGRVKFVFPNRFHASMHDTPSRELFARPMRAFSHGCIRLEKPLELAAYVLREASAGSREAIDTTVASGMTRQVPLPQPLPVHLVYHTAWVDTDGTVHFRTDIYGHDQAQVTAVEAKPPAPCG